MMKRSNSEPYNKCRILSTNTE